MTMALSIRNYFMIPVFVLCIALFYPVSGEPERLIQSVTPKGDYGAEAVLTCSLKTVTDKTVVYWIFGDKNITVGTDNASSNTTASSTTAVTKDGTEMGTSTPKVDMAEMSSVSSLTTVNEINTEPTATTEMTATESGTTASTTVTETPRFTETSTQPTTIKEKSETKSGITSSTNVHVETTDATVTSVTPTLNDTSTDSTAFTKYETETGKTTTENSTNKYKTDIKGQEFIFKIANATEADALNYTCVTEGDHKGVYLNLSFPGKLLKMEPDKDPVIFQLTEGIDEKDRILNLTCVFEVYNQLEIKWILRGGKKEIEKTTRNGTRNNKQLIDTYTEKMRAESFDDQDGTYICQVWDPHSERYLEGKKVVKIIARPTVEINFAKAIGSSEIYFNWTVKNFNSDIKLYELSYRNSSSGQYQYVQDASEKINVTATHYILKNLSSNTAYYLRLRVKTFEYSVNYAVLKNSTEYPNGMVTTLAEDPIFVPNISINGFTARSMTIGMSAPPPDIAEYVHYYQLQEWKKSNPANTTKEAMHIRDERNLPFMFSDLDPHTTYVFKAQACFKYGDMPARCGKWSKEMEAITMDGIPNEPSNVSIHCGGSIDEGYHMNLTWDAPSKPNAEIKGYMMELTGNSSYIDRFGKWKLDTFGPLSKFLTNVTFFTRTLDLKPNMNYTARLMALTRSRRRGQEAEAACGTARAPPDAPPRPRWRKVEENINNERKYSLRVLVPRVAERNGPICCYRVYLVRLPYGKGWIPTPPQDLPVISYDDAHPENPDQYQAVGAYVTDIFNHSPFPPGEIILGDDKMYNIEDDNGTCARCRRAPPRAEPPPARAPPAPAPAPAPATAAPADHDDVAADVSKAKRSADVRGKEIKVQDGPLYRYSNYTLFVELIPADGLSSLYSGYTMALNTDTPPDIVAANAMETALQICCGVAAFLLLATLIFCIVHTRRARKQPPRHAHVELNPIQAALRYVVGHIGGRTPLAPAPPPELPPLAVEDLAAAYAERQADSDYGFQKEFELLQMLPECYPDRTTHASEARENQPKNRYPDIKAYDQTRVKLQQIDGITGSDYINANYVMGYKLKEYEQEKVASEGYWQNIELEEDEEYNHREHKQFICAQGPTDTTVNDFWRMIWEGGLELIVMLTNLEEYSKVKCSKYWPDEDRGSRAFGSITVHHVSEKRYSDYIVRELKIVKQATNSDGQPIVENNGIAKRNGDCKDAESGSVPTSPREVKEDSSRIVRQYHFLMWKDFAAPEHPQSILKFIKRMNEAWSHLMGRPVVVHCSAGVGRTGTLVALDCLLEQLRETRCAAVFTTVAELRRQRNFLVQSLKQYVFVYRALVEYAHYGDTEIPASRLKSSIDRLRNTPEGADKCLMEHQFEKMMNPPVSEPVKSCSAGAVEEARAKNRSPECLPYDRNRVILAPATHTSYSTYINASFIEAYDNSEGYIITQDPLPNTITDFWRMVSEHNVSTIVMLSELGDGKCPRYWDDGTAQYDHISVQYEESESCPYYTRRQFRVTNNKSGDVSTVRQLQYHGWPTAPGHVPEVTRGLAELADAARGPPAMLLHCQHGTERSALFAALCILIAQLRTERRVDVAATARKVRSQRINTINTFLQYEFLHRAILNYAELHNLLEDS